MYKNDLSVKKRVVSSGSINVFLASYWKTQRDAKHTKKT